MKKRIVSLLMALVMAVSLLPTSVFATNETYTEDTDTALAVVEETQSAPALLAAANTKPTVTSYFDGLPIEVTNPTSYAYKWSVDEKDGGYVLKSNNPTNSKGSVLTLTFTAATHVTFECLPDTLGNTVYAVIALNGVEQTKLGKSSTWETLAYDVNKGDKLTITYDKSGSYWTDSDYVYLRNFACGEGVDITFHNGTATEIQKAYGNSVTLKACPFTPAEGQIFAGWATTADGEVVYTDGANVTIGETGLDLYAVWTSASVVTLKDGDKTDTVEVATGEAIGTKLPADPTKNGYTFGGWFNGDTQLTADTLISGDVTYTAQWKPITYTIAFEKGYSEVTGTAVESITATYDKEVTLPECTYTREGYTFNGWGTYYNATSGTAAGETVENLQSKQGATYTYYPAWCGNEVNVTFDPNYMDAETTTRTCAVGNYYTYIRNNDGSTTRSSVADPTREGYIFDGWYDAAEGGNAVTTSYKFTAADAKNGKTLYAHWVEAVTITFDANGGTCSKKNATIKKGATLGYDLPSSYSVSRSGYKFDGWFTEKEGGTEVGAYTTKFETSTTLYAHWTAYTITITFNANGGTGTMDTQVISSGSNTPLNACAFTRNGYVFTGWGAYGSTAVKYEDKALYNETTSYNTTKTLYAIWEPTAEQKAANEVLDKAEEAIGKTNYQPVYGQDTNALTMINARLAAAGITDVKATMKAAEYSSWNYVGIAADGTIQYKWNENGTTDSANGTLTPTIVLTYSKDGKDYTKESEKAKFSIPLDKDKAIAKLKETAERVTVPTTVEQVSDLTTLPCYVLKDGKTSYTSSNVELWATATWTSSHKNIISVGSYDSFCDPYKVGVTLPGEDTTVTLTMTLTYNKSSYGSTYEGELSVTKTYTVTVKAGEDARKELYQTALDEVIAEVGLTNPRTGEAKTKIDYTNVTSDIQFPTTQNIRDYTSLTSFDGKYTPIVITSSDESVIAPVDGTTIANAARMLVYRPLPGEAAKTVTVTMSILNRPSGEGKDYKNMAVLASKTFTLTVQPLTQDEIDTAAAFMEKVCTEEVYWDCIRNGNTDKTNITSDLKWFKEILPTDNEKGYTYITNVDDWNQCGVLAEDIPGWYDSQQYRAFRSSQPDIIRHENLLVTMPQYNTQVTIDSVLSYTEYAKYWEKFGIGDGATEATAEKYAQFAQFYKQPVSTTVTVPGTTGKDDPNAGKAVSAEVSIIGYGDQFQSTATAYTYTAAKAGVNVTAWDAVKACLDENGYTYEGSGSYVSSITDKNCVKLGEKDHGAMSGWMFRVIRGGQTIVPNAVMANYSLKTGDRVELYYVADSVQPIDPTRSADEVEALIAAIGTVSLASEDAITAARTAYDNLAVTEKAFVENYDVLADAEIAFTKLAIEDIGEVTLAKGPTILKARTAYNGLAAAQRTEVTNYATLTAAETKYAALTAEQGKNIVEIYAKTAAELQKNTPTVGGYTGGEWMVLGLSRSGQTVTGAEEYYNGVVSYLNEKMDDTNGHIGNESVTTNARIALALLAMGKDPTNVGGHNLLTAMNSMNFVKRQGLSGPVYTLIALDSHAYTPSGDVTREGLIAAIVNSQGKDGGWSSSSAASESVDMTAMAVQALAPYYSSNSTARNAVDKALKWIADHQNENATFSYKDTWAEYDFGTNTSSESCAQVIVALCALGINPTTDTQFTKNGVTVLDALCSFAVEGGNGFKHSTDETEINAMATEQAYYALAAYQRFADGQTSLYDMTDTHKIGAWTEVTAPTCTTEGSETRTCSTCHITETRTIAALGHIAGTVTYMDKAYHWNLCTRCKAEVNKTAHSYVNGVQCVCGVMKSADGKLKKVEVKNEITVPDTLKETKLNSDTAIKTELQTQLTAKNSKFNKDNTVIMDVTMTVTGDSGGQRPATKADLVNGKITVLIPFPEAVAANYGKYTFAVAHLVTMADCGKEVGTVEFPTVTVTDSGLVVTLTGLSPVAVSYTETPTSTTRRHKTAVTAAAGDKVNSANTADDSQMVLWLGSAVMAAAAITVLKTKKKSLTR